MVALSQLETPMDVRTHAETPKAYNSVIPSDLFKPPAHGALRQPVARHFMTHGELLMSTMLLL